MEMENFSKKAIKYANHGTQLANGSEKTTEISRILFRYNNKLLKQRKKNKTEKHILDN